MTRIIQYDQKAECDSPLNGPRFGNVCLYYDYKIEENTNRGRGNKPRQMRAIEEKIAHGRTIYNEAVREYNDNVRMFPQTLIARRFGFSEHAFFLTPKEKTAPPDIKEINL
jgi:hypothetical protein